MADKAWKAAERRVAALFGSTRTPLSGGNGKVTRSDSLHPRLFIECKYRKRHAPMELFRQTAALAEAENKMPVVVMIEKGKSEFFAVVPLNVEYLASLARELKIANPQEGVMCETSEAVGSGA